MTLNTNEQEIAKEIKELLQSDRLILPTLPEIALKAREVAQDPDVTALGLSKVVQNDPALSARLIRVANSPMMRGQRKIDDLQQAIARMGMVFAGNLISALAMRQMFQATSSTVDHLMHQVWSHSTQVAGIASILCKHYTRLRPDQATLAGLVHQIGILPLLSFAEMRPEVLGGGFTLTRIVEHLHPEIGETILQMWEFPAELVAVPKGHLDLERQVPQVDYIDLVTVANLESIHGTNQALAQVDLERVTAFARLGIKPETLGDAEILAEKKEAAQALN